MLKFIVISDTHIVPKNQRCNGLDSAERLNLAIESINKDHPDADFCIHAGDITDRGDIESYERFHKIIQKLKIPLYLTIGNHDHRNNFKKVLKDEYSDKNGFIQNIIDIKNQRIIILDTYEENLLGEGRLCETRLKWLKNHIIKNDNLPTILVMHHHVTKIQSPYIDLISLENPNDFFNVVKNKSNIRHILTGHVHITSTTIKNNIPQTTIGGSHFTHSVKNFFTPFNYNLNELKNMKDENKISREMIDEMSKQYENIVILEGPAQYGVVFSDSISTTIHFHNYIEEYKRLPQSETKLGY